MACYIIVLEIMAKIYLDGAVGAMMSGSGPTVFGIFSDESRAKEAAAQLKKEFHQTYFCKNAEKPV